MSKIHVLGSGVVGYATGCGLNSLSHDVTFVDISEDRLTQLRDQGHATMHVDGMNLDGIEAVFVAVPTPAGDDGIDASYLEAACKTLGRLLQTIPADQTPLIVFRSTMPPGTTRQLLIPTLEDGSGKRAGVDFLVCYNPEYLREETSVEDFLNFRMLTLGTDAPGDAAAERMRTIFEDFGAAVISEFTYEEAEFQKYVHNVFNATKISFFNEMRLAGRQLGLPRVEAVLALTAKTAEAAWNPVYGTKALGPYGGACLPKDTAAWTGFARRSGIAVPLVDAVRQVNIGLGGSVRG